MPLRLNMSIFSREKIVNSCPNAVKWLYLLCNLQKFSRGACPRTPLEKFRLQRLPCPSPRKILLFHKISMEALPSESPPHSVFVFFGITSPLCFCLLWNHFPTLFLSSLESLPHSVFVFFGITSPLCFCLLWNHLPTLFLSSLESLPHSVFVFFGITSPLCFCLLWNHFTFTARRIWLKFSLKSVATFLTPLFESLHRVHLD